MARVWHLENLLIALIELSEDWYCNLSLLNTKQTLVTRYLPVLVYMHGTCLTFGKPSDRKPLTTRYFLIDSAKSVEALIELSEDCYCNLSLLNTKQTDFNYKVSTLSSLYAWHVFDIWKTFWQETINNSVFFNRFCEKRGSADRIIRGLLL